jgi:hypothetical protein
MSVITDLQTALAASLGTVRAYPNVAPDSAAMPYVTFSRISSVEENSMAVNGGAGNLANTRFQLDVWAATYAQAQTTSGVVKAALKAWSVTNVINIEQDLYESETKSHRVMIDFSTWHY